MEAIVIADLQGRGNSCENTSTAEPTAARETIGTVGAPTGNNSRDFRAGWNSVAEGKLTTIGTLYSNVNNGKDARAELKPQQKLQGRWQYRKTTTTEGSTSAQEANGTSGDANIRDPRTGGNTVKGRNVNHSRETRHDSTDANNRRDATNTSKARNVRNTSSRKWSEQH